MVNPQPSIPQASGGSGGGGPGAGAGGGIQTRVGVLVRAYETFIEMQQMEAAPARPKQHLAAEDGV